MRVVKVDSQVLLVLRAHNLMAKMAQMVLMVPMVLTAPKVARVARAAKEPAMVQVEAVEPVVLHHSHRLQLCYFRPPSGLSLNII